ncbi:MAG: DMT family transporter [Candidatus Bipolaricaulota bacterium]|nr:DMT family transporter [Candidatus Bipolaricaulota bacterium]
MAHLGEWAALATAALWSGSYLAFTAAVRRIGADRVNRLRLLFAVVILAAAHFAVYGVPLPTGADASRWLWLSLSGVVGFTIADAFLFRALYHLGPHRTSVVTALVPVASAFMAWIVLGERLSGMQFLGVAVTVSAVALIVSARSQGEDGVGLRNPKLGVLFALGTVVAQSARYLLSVKGMSGGFPVLSSNVLQIFAATVAAWILALPRGEWRETFRGLRDRTAAGATAAGAMVGPVLGVTLSLVALANSRVGVASTLMALTPVFLLPLSAFAFHERITWRSVAGTVLAVGGVAVLWLS